MQRPIYLDYNATTPLDPRVLEGMLPFFKEDFGNASSVSHAYGWQASQAVEKARKQAAAAIQARPMEIFWTSGATESNNLALLGVFDRLFEKSPRPATPPHMITSLTEHKAVLDVAKALEKRGVNVTYLKPDSYGQVSAQDVQAALKPETVLISLMLANNEIGTINPIAEIGQVARNHNVLLHVDAAQAVGKLAIDVKKMHIDLLSASGHKIYGPKGVGYLYVGERVAINPCQFGGSQEKSLRPGTLNVPAIVGFGLALEIAEAERGPEDTRLKELQGHFISRLREKVPNVILNGHPLERLSNNISISLPDISPESFALGLSGLAISSGSACSGSATSYVLRAIGHPEDLARATLRIGIGRFTQPQDLDLALEKIARLPRKSANF